ncbi:MAG: glycosyltransferase [Candidatus Peregrinibacteria bacterium GW2011_GWF2_43_17]|nr:MAG: glycosyltransferase [Candidatus Peregrinibacteria bacterium GW2011_GWF2_43_17]KKT19655.1 MAG: Glycosyltransferase [Candidatus Peregrinibacteria bacterium GW2011_GWA2_43_8]
MKILIVTPIFPPEIGGPATYTWELTHRLKNHDVSVVAFGDKSDELAGSHLLKVRKGFSRKIPVIGSFIRQMDLYFSILKHGRDCDLIYLQGPLVVGYFGSLAAKKLKKPIVMKFVGDIAWETASSNGKTDKNLDEFLESGGGGFLRKLQLKSFHRADAIVVPSEYLRDILCNYYSVPTTKIDVIYNAVSVPEPDKKLGEDKSVVTVGRLVKHKNIAGIIEAMSLLQNHAPKLVVVGSGPELNNLKSLASQLGLADRVVFKGALSRRETLREVANADLFVLNSIYEGLPHTVVEAMYLKTPVVASDILGTTEVANEKTATLAESKNAEDLAKKIEAALSNPDTNKTEEAYKFVSGKFNWERNLYLLESLFSRLCRK